MKQSNNRQLCIRLDVSLYEKIQNLAVSRNTSINKLAIESLRKLIDESMQIEMKKAYALLAQDYNKDNIEEFFTAQNEVIEHD